MAVFNFGSVQADSSDPDAFVQAVQDADVTVLGSVVAGNSYGVTSEDHRDDDTGK